ncbi:MAG: glycosyltransferase [Rhodospirillaceae bacterium]
MKKTIVAPGMATDKLETCPVCDFQNQQYLFLNQGTPIVKCGGCGLILRNPQPSDECLDSIYSASYFIGSDEASLRVETNRLKRLTGALYLDEVEKFRRYHGDIKTGGRLLEIGCGLGNLLLEAKARGYDVTGVEVSASAAATANERLGDQRVHQGTVEEIDLPPASFDVCILADVIEHTRDPVRFLGHIYELVRPGGVVFIAVPSLDSWSAQLMREHWVEFKAEHLFYFDRQTVQNLMFRTGFRDIELVNGQKELSFDYIFNHFKRFPTPFLTPIAHALGRILPHGLRQKSLRLVASGINVLARRDTQPAPDHRCHRLSIVLPVYNERGSFRQLIDAVLDVDMPSLDIDVIVVESNSTDGTREEALTYSDHPRIKVILEDRPLGKGHAVRTGLAHAIGDFILIQDADLEYDINDYGALLEPLRTYRNALVLGSRHNHEVTWKFRHFSDSVHLSTLMNVGHFFFTRLFNAIYGQRLNDPFTMYKVFRRDCLTGLALEANRFDFDWELLGKLVRRGYKPLEIPVNYCSRSFKEGKKVRFLRDPLTWLVACFKYRFVSVAPDRQIPSPPLTTR